MPVNVLIPCLHLLIFHGNEKNLDLEESPDDATYSMLSHMTELNRPTPVHSINYVCAFILG